MYGNHDGGSFYVEKLVSSFCLVFPKILEVNCHSTRYDGQLGDPFT